LNEELKEDYVWNGGIVVGIVVGMGRRECLEFC